MIVMLSFNSIDSTHLLSPISMSDVPSHDDIQIVSAYDETSQAIIVKFYLEESATIGLELYNRDGVMLKLWQPQIADQGQYLSSLTLEEIPDGTYLLNVIVNEDMYQQAVFKY